MPRYPTQTLTDAELRLMKVIWREGDSSTSEVVEVLAAEGVELAPSSVRTILSILEDKGYLTSRIEGRSRCYKAIVSRGEARREALGYFLGSFFDGSREELLLNLLKDEQVGEAELERLRRLVEEEAGDV